MVACTRQVYQRMGFFAMPAVPFTDRSFDFARLSVSEAKSKDGSEMTAGSL